MKGVNREENATILHFMLYLVLTLGLVLFTVFKIYPDITIIEENKTESKIIYNDLKRIEKGGLSFEEFKKSNLLGTQNKFISEIVKNISEEFYNKNLLNTTDTLYKDFIENKKKELNNTENKATIDGNSKKISKILPLYSENITDFSNELLTDYKFINYIESIVESFNFTTDNSIGIKNLTLVKEFSTNESGSDGLDSNIYFIPLKLELEGTKSDVIQFLYFVENVGKIDVIDNDIKLNTNYGFLSKNGIKKILVGDKYTKNYNLFEHQIIDISKISMNEYLDSSYLSRGSKGFSDFILETQGNDDFSANIDLMFYVKGQPNYKIEEFILQILDKYNKTNILITNGLKNTDITGIERINLVKNNSTIKQLSKDIVNIRKELKKKDKLDSLYKRALKLNTIIEPIFNKLKK